MLLNTHRNNTPATTLSVYCKTRSNQLATVPATTIADGQTDIHLFDNNVVHQASGLVCLPPSTILTKASYSVCMYIVHSRRQQSQQQQQHRQQNVSLDIFMFIVEY